jgi:energy-coupling factor transporter ATP-binding protein EcfA2
MGKSQYIDLRGETYAAGLRVLIETLKTTVPGQLIEAQTDSSEPGELLPSFRPRNPYKGLNAFTANDQRDFFGRNGLIQSLQDHLKKSNFLAVVGPSGSGKSSVVMAGLLPQLENGMLPGSDQWVYLPPFVPGMHPLEAMAITLKQALPNSSINALHDDLASSSARGLHLLSQSIVGPRRTRLVMFIDQFEELFTLCTQESEREQFINVLTTAITEPQSALNLILTMRADFSDRPMAYTEFANLIAANTLPIVPLSLSDLRDVIERPAALPDVQVSFENGLVAELVFEVRNQAGALPLLQFTLDQLFELAKESPPS